MAQIPKETVLNNLAWQIQHFAAHLPWPTREYQFHPTREWRFDLCWPAPLLKLAVEINGGIWRRGGGAHTGTGHMRDLEKGNAALLLGYRVLHFVPEQVMDGDRIIPIALDTILEMFVNLGYKPNGG